MGNLRDVLSIDTCDLLRKRNPRVSRGIRPLRAYHCFVVLLQGWKSTRRKITRRGNGANKLGRRGNFEILFNSQLSWKSLIPDGELVLY